MHMECDIPSGFWTRNLTLHPFLWEEEVAVWSRTHWLSLPILYSLLFAFFFLILFFYFICSLAVSLLKADWLQLKVAFFCNCFLFLVMTWSNVTTNRIDGGGDHGSGSICWWGRHFSLWAVDKMFFYFYFLWCFYYITFVFYLVLSWRNCV